MSCGDGHESPDLTDEQWEQIEAQANDILYLETRYIDDPEFRLELDRQYPGCFGWLLEPDQRRPWNSTQGVSTHSSFSSPS